MTHTPANHPVVNPIKTGVLVVNLGSPDDLSTASVRRYLREFLSDKRVIDLPRLAWLPILHGIILNTRPRKTAAAYKKIWWPNCEQEEGTGAPLKVMTKRQAASVQEFLDKEFGANTVVVRWAMRYASPSIASQLQELRDAKCDRILVMPLYPQYAGATTATVNDKVFDELKKMAWQPALRTLAPYYDHPLYIDALAKSVTEHYKSLGWQPDMLLTSYHGMPKRYLTQGDPYHCHCAKTTRLLREKLGWAEDKVKLSFQSRFGPAEWLKPYTDEVLEELPAKGIKKLAVMTPSFSADCLETLEEIAMEGKETFLAAGGEQFTFIPCLNDDAAGLHMLHQLTLENLSGFVQKSPTGRNF